MTWNFFEGKWCWAAHRAQPEKMRPSGSLPDTSGLRLIHPEVLICSPCAELTAQIGGAELNTGALLLESAIMLRRSGLQRGCVCSLLSGKDWPVRGNESCNVHAPEWVNTYLETTEVRLTVSSFLINLAKPSGSNSQFFSSQSWRWNYGWIIYFREEKKTPQRVALNRRY